MLVDVVVVPVSTQHLERPSNVDTGTLSGDVDPVCQWRHTEHEDRDEVGDEDLSDIGTTFRKPRGILSQRRMGQACCDRS